MGTDETFRLILAMILVTAVGISGYHRRRAQQTSGAIARRQEAPRLIALRLAFGLPLLFSLLAFLVRPGLVTWARAPIPESIRWIGVAIGVMSVPLVVWVMKSIGPNISETVLTKREHVLVTHGPYRWVRHPLYITGLLLLISATLIASNWLIGTLTVVAAIAIRYIVIPTEEAALLEKFGDHYREYMMHAGRLLPNLHA
jgi:protein-S-isoprenylcysteine O-methyltransferase Ste14